MVKKTKVYKVKIRISTNETLNDVRSHYDSQDNHEQGEANDANSVCIHSGQNNDERGIVPFKHRKSNA